KPSADDSVPVDGEALQRRLDELRRHFTPRSPEDGAESLRLFEGEPPPVIPDGQMSLAELHEAEAAASGVPGRAEAVLPATAVAAAAAVASAPEALTTAPEAGPTAEPIAEPGPEAIAEAAAAPAVERSAESPSLSPPTAEELPAPAIL